MFILHVHLFLSQLLECYVSLCEQLSAGGEEEHSNLSPSIAPLAQSLDSKWVESTTAVWVYCNGGKIVEKIVLVSNFCKTFFLLVVALSLSYVSDYSGQEFWAII